MTTDQLRDAHGRRPFVPFVIRHADGKETRVSHPESLAYGGGRVAVVVDANGRVEIIDLLLVPTLLFDEVREPRRKKRGDR
jgi:hypothetical protein